MDEVSSLPVKLFSCSVILLLLFIVSSYSLTDCVLPDHSEVEYLLEMRSEWENVVLVVWLLVLLSLMLLMVMMLWL